MLGIQVGLGLQCINDRVPVFDGQGTDGGLDLVGDVVIDDPGAFNDFFSCHGITSDSQPRGHSPSRLNIVPYSKGGMLQR